MLQKILIVEDDTSFGTMLERLLQKRGYATTLCSRIEAAKRELAKNSYQIILSDLRLPDGDGILLLEWINSLKIDTPVIIVTSYAEVQTAVAAMRLGAFDYLEKPINPAILDQKLQAALAKGSSVAEEPQAKQMPAGSKSVMVKGDSPAAAQLYHHIDLVAPTNFTVLILGESGTGKEYAARAIHQSSSRSSRPFIAVDCGSLSKELAPSELFGHLKGSFTSAMTDKKGVFEQAKGGTVFLDEIGNLSYEVQVQLLRALQEQKVRPVGSATDVKIDVRILAATNENLDKAIANGTFREDLYHRLNEFCISVPPLRERVEDIEMFANHFLAETNRELGKDIKKFSKQALKALQSSYWSGNLRELRNVVRRAALFAQDDIVTHENLPPLTPAPMVRQDTDAPISFNLTREQIEAALKRARGNKSLAARMLSIDRKTLYNKMHQLGMEI